MPSLFGQVVIPHRDLILANAVVNTFNWTGVDDVEDMCTAALGRLKDFYNTVPAGGTFAINRYISTEMNLPGARLKLYDISDPEPRVPVFDESLALVQGTPADTQNLPSEVAVCTSYAAAPASGSNPRRTRGRIYIGPLNVGARTNVSNQTARPDTTFISNLYRATRDLAEANTLGCSWMIWSRKNNSGEIIHQGWVDNAFDTQRRRGAMTTTRTSWEVETDP